MKELNKDVLLEEDMQNYYFTRTVEHIHRVQNNALVLATLYSDIFGLSEEEKRVFMADVMLHDSSKFSFLQYEAYKVFSWKIKHDIALTEEEQEAFDKAWVVHYNIENHHITAGGSEDCDDFSILEIACDLQAMAQEFNEGDYENYYRTKWLPKFDKIDFPRCLNVAVWRGKLKVMLEKALECFKDYNGTLGYELEPIEEN